MFWLLDSFFPCLVSVQNLRKSTLKRCLLECQGVGKALIGILPGGKWIAWAWGNVCLYCWLEEIIYFFIFIRFHNQQRQPLNKFLNLLDNYFSWITSYHVCLHHLKYLDIVQLVQQLYMFWLLYLIIRQFDRKIVIGLQNNYLDCICRLNHMKHLAAQ